MMNILRDEKQTRRACPAAQDCLRLCSARTARPGRDDEWMRGAEKQMPGAVHRYVRCRSSARGIS